MQPQTYRLRLQTVSPVHIGNGDTITALSYLLDGGKVHVLDADKFFAALDEAQRDAYVRWLDTQLRGQGQNNPSVRNFLEQRVHLRNIAEFVAKVSGYSVTLQADPGITARGIRQHIQTPQHQPYIPGSTLKGAMRTALIEALLDDDASYNWLRQRFEQLQVKNDERDMKRALADIWKSLEAKLLRGGQDEAHFDFLRFIAVSDTAPFPTGALSVRLTRSEGTTRTTSTWIETIPPDQTTTLTLTFYPNAPLDSLRLDEALRDYLTIDKLFAVLHQRAKRRLEEEAKYRAQNKPLPRIAELQALNQPDAPLLRIGAGQGYLGTTVMGTIKRRDPQLYRDKVVPGVKVTLGRRGANVQTQNFPKTRRTVRDNESQHQAQSEDLLGWVKLQRML
ncbi:MAG: type III-A CRISPR-associated RAMP protein Csm5 [Abditibacteriales bacterium]|nr:type III-A CRISPR-associated RAMP protein Csm5 [Abditibacteriales bacterium]